MRKLAIFLSLGLIGASVAHAVPGVSLRLHGARATRDLVIVQAELHNRTGRALTARTNFQSVFDDVALVISDSRGRALHRIHYTHHQSPFAEHRPIPLPPGSTRQELRFPTPPLTPGRYRVRLEGGLVGHPRFQGLRTRDHPVLIR